MRRIESGASGFWCRRSLTTKLLRTLVTREATAFVARVDEQISGIEDPEEALVAAWLAFMCSLREHDLVQRLLVTDPDRILPLLTTEGAPALALGREYVLSVTRRAIEQGAEPAAGRCEAARARSRLRAACPPSPRRSAGRCRRA
jgi:hypothetical protein